MEEKLLNEEEEELYGFKLKTDPLEDDEGKKLEAKEDEFFIREESETEDAEFEFPEATEDDESLVMLTPEQAQRLVRKRAEREQKKEELFGLLMQDGKNALSERDFERARERFTQANELKSDDLELNVNYMRAYSEDFTATDDLSLMCEVYAQCFESAGEPFAKRIKEEFGGVLQRELERLTQEEEKAYAEFSLGQEERREEYTARVNLWGGRLLWTGIPCLTLAVVSIIFLSLIDSIQGSLFVILSASFGGVAAVLFIFVLFFSNRYFNARRLQSENEKLSSTKEGRNIEKMQNGIEFLKYCLR